MFEYRIIENNHILGIIVIKNYLNKLYILPNQVHFNNI